jgi:hypothetical protein
MISATVAMPIDEWDDLNRRAYERCIAEKSYLPLVELNRATGIEWFEPAMPGKLPPTPGKREGFLNVIDRLPRRLRRHAKRMLTCEDYDGAIEVLATLDDADLEFAIIRLDRRITYLEYLLTIMYDFPVAHFLSAMLEWLTGELGWRLEVLAALKRAIPLNLPSPTAPPFPRDSMQFKPPPAQDRPCVEPTGPPSHVGVTRRLIHSSA